MKTLTLGVFYVTTILGWTCCECLAVQTRYTPDEKMQQNGVSSHAANVEFLSTLSEFLQEGIVATVEEIEKHYKRIASDHGLKKKKSRLLKTDQKSNR